MGRLAGKKALITGSSSGIGAAVAIAFAEEGADVVINFPDQDQENNAQSVIEKIRKAGANAFSIRADVSQEDEVEKLVEKALLALGRIDILVNNAGYGTAEPLEQITVENWDRMIAVNLRGIFLVTRLVLPHMYEQNYGKIICTASHLAYSGAAGMTHYTATKGAIIAFTRSLALEIGDRDINVNCVAPGATRTPAITNFPEEMLEAMRQTIPKKRIAEVDEIAPTYVFLVSEDSRYYQGQCLSPNGGFVFL